MLRLIDAEDFLIIAQTNFTTNLELITTLSETVLRQQNGELLVTKIKYTKNNTYLNIYEYDKTSWRYLLTQSIKI